LGPSPSVRLGSGFVREDKIRLRFEEIEAVRRRCPDFRLGDAPGGEHGGCEVKTSALINYALMKP
jgi:hypothetical protein